MGTERAPGAGSKCRTGGRKAVAPWDAERSSRAVAELGADGCRRGCPALPLVRDGRT